jgi:hypothetical protein
MKFNYKVLITFAVIILAAYYFHLKSTNEKNRRPSSEDDVPNVQAHSSSTLPGATNSTDQSNQQKAQQPTSKTSTEALEKFLNSQSPGWKLQKDEYGNVTSILGGHFQEPVKNDSDAYALAQQLATYLKISPTQILQGTTPEASRTTIYTFKQFAGGLEVYQSYMNVITNTENGSVVMVNNYFKSVETIPNTENFSKDQAWLIVKNNFPNEAVEEIQLVNRNSSVIFVPADPNQKPQLAWIFHIVLPAREQTQLEIAVGAESGKIVSTSKLTVN